MTARPTAPHPPETAAGQSLGAMPCCLSSFLDRVIIGDNCETLAAMPAESVDLVVTSPPYWGLRDYGTSGQIGMEETPKIFVQKLVDVFDQVRRVMKNDGTLWLNIGDSYARQAGNEETKYATMHTVGVGQINCYKNGAIPAKENKPPDGMKAKDMMGIPWMLAFALRDAGWFLRQEIIWHKPNPMPESVKDRTTKSHEHIFLLTKSPTYKFNQIKGKNGENMRSVWSIPVTPSTKGHFAAFPELLAKRCVAAGSNPGDVVLDPFAGSGTTLKAAKELGRRFVGIEINPEYVEICQRRIAQDVLNLFPDNDKLRDGATERRPSSQET